MKLLVPLVLFVSSVSLGQTTQERAQEQPLSDIETIWKTLKPRLMAQYEEVEVRPIESCSAVSPNRCSALPVTILTIFIEGYRDGNRR